MKTISNCSNYRRVALYFLRLIISVTKEICKNEKTNICKYLNVFNTCFYLGLNRMIELFR